MDAMRALAEKRGDYMIRIDPMLEETDTAFLDEVRRLGFTVNQGERFFPVPAAHVLCPRSAGLHAGVASGLL